MDINQSIITAIIGFISGGLGSIVTPWVKWGIEKRKLKLAQKTQIINNIKSILSNEVFDPEKLVNQTDYYSIREHLSKKTIERLEIVDYDFYCKIDKSPVDSRIAPLLKELSNLEKKWGIR